MRNTVPLISFTFDDFPRSALHAGGDILRSYGVAGTYYASFGLMNQDSPVGPIFLESDLAGLVADGHELGCHTFAHCSAWKTPARDFETSLLENRRALARVLPQAGFRTMSYPIDGPHPRNKQTASWQFACCRGGGQTFNSGTLDRNHVRAFFLEQSRNEPELIKDMIDRNCRAGGWLVFATHDIRDSPSRFGCTPGFFEDIIAYAARSGARILPVAAAWDTACGQAAVT
jgi:peptidoglycan/xylan/chitin deacetylase (PgdA/CDA1 family)